MKFRFLVLMLLPLFTKAQTGSLTIFSEQGDPFYLYLNGNKMNDTAVTKIRLEGLSGEYYTVKVDFKSASIAPLSKRLYLLDGNDKMSDATYRIRKDKSGKARFSFYAMQSAESGFVPGKDVKVVRFNQELEESEIKTEKPKEENTLLTNVKGATVSTPKNTPEQNQKIKKDTIAVQKAAIVQKKNEVKEEVKKEVKQEIKEVKKVDSVKTVVKTEVKKSEPQKVDKKDAQDKTEPVKQPVAKNDYPSKKCNDWPMMKTEFVKAKSVVEAAKNDQQRLKKAKEMATENCLLVSQVSEVSNLLEDEKVKLEFLKYSYGFIIDRNNFSRLEKVLTKPELIKEFKAFHQARTGE